MKMIVITDGNCDISWFVSLALPDDDDNDVEEEDKLSLNNKTKYNNNNNTHTPSASFVLSSWLSFTSASFFVVSVCLFAAWNRVSKFCVLASLICVLLLLVRSNSKNYSSQLSSRSSS